ncbi:DUF3168 domain-containing protein [Bosea sp. RCC_152_1]|uniref:DUF3168 domain-containing protein n=1 Tax=Bosea sp. RCC_152_1 TaxID=3239228 RepID=UPI003526AEDB
MIDPAYAVQALIHHRLTTSPAVTALVPAENIGDVSDRPRGFPSIIIGEGHALYSDRHSTFHEQVTTQLHVWTEEDSLVDVKLIAGAVREALRDAPWSTGGHVCHGISISRGAFMRDPDGKHGHAVLYVDATLQERAAVPDAAYGEVFP